jgi:hypothetical protein
MIIGGILITMAFIVYLSHRSSSFDTTINKHSLKYYKLRWRTTPF